ncbi:aminotransferase [Cereibacter sphaeroides]|uniref:aminotransferase n=1 Tax=Cereibacter sphaeroides TaxID=1063 RepID=UPI000B2D994A|nr:aminotransferase [Cereibacter sphaeroides]
MAVGFSEPRLAEAAARQMAELPYYHTFAGKAHEPQIRLAEKLVEMTPEALTRVFFTNSGSEANDTVVKLVWFMNNALGRPQKKKFLSRIKGYHGITIASGSLTGLPVNHKGFDLPAIPVVHLGCPHHWRFGAEGESEAEFCARLLREAEETILAEGPETVAAFIGEPVMGAGGVIVPPDGYWSGIEALCRKYDILLVSDEVINGFGRTGARWGCEKFGFTPDILVTSKQLTSSYMPLAAVLMTDKVYQTIADHTETLGTLGRLHRFGPSGRHGGGLENLTVIEERDLMGNAARLERPFQDGLRAFRDNPLVGEVRGTGLIAAIEMVADRATKRSFEPLARWGRAPRLRGRRRSPLPGARRHAGALPAADRDEADVGRILERMGRALDRTADWARAEGLI